MSTQTGKWREEQVLVLCPGSQTTLAQLGCNELTPPAHRFPTRMFRDSESTEDYWRPYHTYRRKKDGSGDNSSGGGLGGEGGKGDGEGEGEWEYVEDVDSVEGAVYPIQGE